MIAIIAGGRDRHFSVEDYEWLTEQWCTLDFDAVVHGDYGKTDKAADRWARFHGLYVTPFPPDWDRFGPWAGPRRNQQMIDYIKERGEDAVLITFHGGPGTADMIRRATQAGLPHVLRECQP